jgi:hypothetical protein
MKKPYKRSKLNRYGTLEALTQSYSSFYGKGKGKGKKGNGRKREISPYNSFS